MFCNQGSQPQIYVCMYIICIIVHSTCSVPVSKISCRCKWRWVTRWTASPSGASPTTGPTRWRGAGSSSTCSPSSSSCPPSSCPLPTPPSLSRSGVICRNFYSHSCKATITKKHILLVYCNISYHIQVVSKYII